jgi:nucleoside-diphosphate-sugar epimerase
LEALRLRRRERDAEDIELVDMSTKAFVAGISGAMGHYLTEALLRQGYGVAGLGRRPSVSLNADYYQCDLSDPIAAHYVTEIMQTVKPAYVFYVAGVADVRRSFDDPQWFIDNNFTAWATFLRGVANSDQRPLIVLASTSEVYGNVAAGDPITERQKFAPISPYAVTKVSQEHLAFSYRETHNLQIVITRAFGYINPLRANLFATAMARKVVACERGEAVEIVHGDLSPVRSFCDVRDVAEAYVLAAEKGLPGEAYNVGYEHGVFLGKVLEQLMELSTVGGALITRVDKKLLRPTDVLMAIPDCSKFRFTTGWCPRIVLRDSLAWLLGEVRRSCNV